MFRRDSISENMHTRKPEHDAFYLVGLSIVILITIIVFAYLLFVVWPMNAVAHAENASVSVNGVLVDPLVAKVATVQMGYYNQAVAMVNGSYWK